MYKYVNASRSGGGVGNNNSNNNGQGILTLLQKYLIQFHVHSRYRIPLCAWWSCEAQ